MREREARLLRRAEGRGGLLRHAVRRALHVPPRQLQLRHPQELVPPARLRHEDAAYGVRGDRDGHEVRLLPRGEREEGRLFVLRLVRHGRRARLRGHRGRLRVPLRRRRRLFRHGARLPPPPARARRVPSDRRARQDQLGAGLCRAGAGDSHPPGLEAGAEPRARPDRAGRAARHGLRHLRPREGHHRRV